MVDRAEVEEVPRGEPAHPRVRLIDRVPPEPLLDAADRFEAFARVELDCPVDVRRPDLDAAIPTSLGRLVQLPAGQSEPWLVLEGGDQSAEVVSRHLDVAVE